ncbi:MAG TPA: hypothetical protein VGF33_03320 [Caulobacteraceae bacterium]|jgi:hypothetical protein
MATAARVPITNVHKGGAYTATILVGAQKRPMTVIVDTGSSALALDPAKYRPAAGDQTTKLAQSVGYAGGGGWTGAVIKTDIAIGDGAAMVTQKGANAAIAYQMSANVFGAADGILGLAYAELNGAWVMPDDTWARRYTEVEVNQGQGTTIAPGLTRLAAGKAVSKVIALYTQRSLVHQDGGDAGVDPLNQGYMIVGGGQTGGGLYADLYTGAFQTVKVVADQYFNTNLKAIIVGGEAAIAVPAGPVLRFASNSIVDSGNPALSFGPVMLDAVLAKFTAAQQAQLKASLTGPGVATGELHLGAWPSLTFIFAGETGDIRLNIAPGDYWQVNAPQAGLAMAAIKGDGIDGGVSFGLPLMNGYLTVFDGGRRAIRFATSKR